VDDGGLPACELPSVDRRYKQAVTVAPVGGRGALVERLTMIRARKRTRATCLPNFHALSEQTGDRSSGTAVRCCGMVCMATARIMHDAYAYAYTRERVQDGGMCEPHVRAHATRQVRLMVAARGACTQPGFEGFYSLGAAHFVVAEADKDAAENERGHHIDERLEGEAWAFPSVSRYTLADASLQAPIFSGGGAEIRLHERCSRRSNGRRTLWRRWWAWRVARRRGGRQAGRWRRRARSLDYDHSLRDKGVVGVEGRDDGRREAHTVEAGRQRQPHARCGHRRVREVDCGEAGTREHTHAITQQKDVTTAGGGLESACACTACALACSLESVSGSTRPPCVVLAFVAPSQPQTIGSSDAVETRRTWRVPPDNVSLRISTCSSPAYRMSVGAGKYCGVARLRSVAVM
jgi:hypothetical protein